MDCPKCKTELTMMVNMAVSMPSSWESLLTKKKMSSKDFKVWGVSWGTASYCCGKCGYATKDI